MNELKEAWAKYDTLLEKLGAEDFLFELAEAMSTDQKNEFFDYVARNNDVEFD